MNLDRELRPLPPEVDGDERTLADLTSRSPRGVVYQALLKKYRTPRTTRRPDIVGMDVFEDNAPDWLWMLAKDILEHTGYEDDLGMSLLVEAITWVELGDEVARSARLRDPRTRASVGRVEDAAYIAEMRRFLKAAYLEPKYLAKEKR
jgi:hypothetical protein